MSYPSPPSRSTLIAAVAGILTVVVVARMPDGEGIPVHEDLPVERVNAVVGDDGYVAFFGRRPGAGTSEIVRIQTHLAYVEALLRARPTDRWTEVQRVRREANLERLRAYRLAGVFPRNTYRTGRTPVFIDESGRLCAVGYLVARTAGVAVARAINDRHRLSAIADIDTSELVEWAAANGLSLDELAMIQPAYCGFDPGDIGCVGDEKDHDVEIAAIAINSASVLVNGWMAARGQRNRIVAGVGMLTGAAGLAVGVTRDTDYRSATIATAGTSVLLAGWNLVRQERPNRLTIVPEVTPRWDPGEGTGLDLTWTF